MGVETAIGAGIAGATGLAGAAKGAKGTPDKKEITQTVLPEASGMEKNLQDQSYQQYQQQQQLINDMQSRLGMYDQMQNQAIGNTQNILSGQAFQLTPQEQQQISNLRQAMIDEAQAPVQQLIDQNLRKVQSSAAQRNLRGQAAAEQSGRVLSTGAEQLGAATRNAATQSAQLSANLPYQRVAAQSGAVNQGLNLRNSLAQQAIANRQIAQSPALLQNLLQERMAQATRTSTTPGGGGGWTGALLGGLSGAGTGVGGYADLRSAFNSLGAASSPFSGVSSSIASGGYGGLGAADLLGQAQSIYGADRVIT